MTASSPHVPRPSVRPRAFGGSRAEGGSVFLQGEFRTHFFMKTCIALIASLLLSVFAPAAEWATNFNLPAVNGSVLAIAETPDAFYYGGSFTQVGSVAANNIVRVDKTTGALTPLGSATQNGTGGLLPTSPADVRALAVIGTDLYVAGNFNRVSSNTQNAISANLIAKWSTITNTWSPLGSASQNGTAGGIDALAVSGTDLYVGGLFSRMWSSTQNGISANNVAKWDTVTGLWSPLGSASQNGVQSGSQVLALAVSGQDLYVGGTFSNVSSSTQVAISAKYIAKWDMSGSTWSPLGDATQNGTSTIVDTLAISGTDVYAGGSFTTVSSSTQNAISAKGVAKWDSSAQIWVPLGTGTQNGVSGSVDSLAVSGTSLYVGGSFYEVYSATQSSFAANDIACWDMVAGTWSALGEGLQLGTGSVEALAVSGSDLHAGGTFREIGGILNTSGIGKWNITASSWGPAVPVVPGDGIIGSGAGTIDAFVDAGSVVYVAGSFTFAGSVAANNIACWNKATRTWSVLGSAAQNGTNGAVNVMILIGTDLYVGGSFTTVSSSSQNGVFVGNIAKWDTINGVWSPLGSAAQNGTNYIGFVNAFAVLGDDLYVGGSFTTVGSSTQSAISAKGVAKWSLSQESWSPLGTGVQNGLAGTVFGLAVSGSDLYVGGSFSTVSSSTQNGISANNVAKWSTETSEWSPLGSAAQNGTSFTVKSLAANGGSIYVGGNFLTVSSSTQSNISARRVARWDVAGSMWAPLGSAAQNGTGSNVEALVMKSGDLYVAGGFTTVSSATQNAISARGVARWNETSGTWSQLGSATQNGVRGGSATVNALALSGTDLYVGGYFDSVSSDTQNAIASVRVGVYGPVSTPDISVEQPAGNLLTDGTASVSFGGVVMAGDSAPVTFTVKNTGTTDLTLATISKDGAHPGDFTVDTTGMLTTLPPGGSTAFTVIFSPAAEGARSAALHIASDVVGSKNPFDIALTGTGTSDDADLSALTLSDGVLAPAFAAGTTAYTANVTNANSSLTVTPTRAEANATIEVRVNGGSFSPVTSGSPSGALALNVGSNTIDLRVTAQSGNTKTYTVTVTRDKASQTITFANPGDQLTTATVNLSATGGGSTSLVTFAVTSGPGSISGGNVLTFTGAGSVTITASQAGDANYYPATLVARTFTVTKATALVTLNSLSQIYDGTPKVAGATTNPSGKTVTFTYDISSTAPTNAGSYSVAGTIDDLIYQGTANGTLVIAKAAQVINFANPGTQFSTANVNLSATGGASGNPVTFAVAGGPATITNDTLLSFTGTGSVTITASQVGNSNHETATPVARTFDVIAPPEITLSGNGQPIDNGDLTPSADDHTDFGSVAITGGTLARTFTVANSGTTVLHLTGTPRVEISGPHAGDFTVTADPLSPVEPGGGTTTFTITFDPSAAGVRSATVGLANNDPDEDPATFVIQGDGLPSDNADLSVLTLSSGALAPAFDAATTGYTASVSTSITVTPTAAQANATIEVRVNGGSYSPVTSGSPSGTLALNVGSNTIDIQVTAQDTTTIKVYTVTVTRDKASQTITFANPGDQIATATVNLSATGGGSGNAVTFAVSDGPGSISGGNVLTFTGAGSVTITASQAGNSEYHDATPVARTFNVSLASQTLTFDSPGDRFLSEILTLAATGGGSGSGLVYEVVSGPGVITNGNELSFTGGGDVTVRVSQAGDDLHAAADPVEHTFAVLLPRPDVAVGRSPSSLVGSEVYAPSVQLASLVSTKARPVTGFLALGNRVVLPDGRAADAVVLRGGRGNAFFKVAYLAPTGNETAAVLAGTYQTPLVDADDAAVPLRSVVTPNKKKLTKQKGRTKVILRKTLVLPLSASSSLDPAIQDAASIRVQTK